MCLVKKRTIEDKMVHVDYLIDKFAIKLIFSQT
nr:MAG TPA: hypothetical protein [Caudoviricetes sp.]DAO15448.1 MAG TPA: hypothetical protein [Caudoviricetes sp.]